MSGTVASSQPDASRRRLGLMLRDLRKRQDLSGKRLGECAGIGQSTISKIETGRYWPIDERLIKAMLNGLAASDVVRAAVLDQFAICQLDPHLYQAIQHNGVAQKQAEIGALEAQARSVRVYETVLVPGLLQLPAYAAAVFDELGVEERSIAAAVSARITRQAVLAHNGRTFQFVINEAVLYARHGSVSSWGEQRRWIERLSHKPNVQITILAMRDRLPPSAATPFTIINDRYVTVETAISEQVWTAQVDVNGYLRAYQELSKRGQSISEFTRYDPCADELSREWRVVAIRVVYRWRIFPRAESSASTRAAARRAVFGAAHETAARRLRRSHPYRKCARGRTAGHHPAVRLPSVA